MSHQVLLALLGAASLLLSGTATAETAYFDRTGRQINETEYRQLNPAPPITSPPRQHPPTGDASTPAIAARAPITTQPDDTQDQAIDAGVCRVTSVADGDTLTLICSGREERIRLYGIDCPEGGQAFGQQAKQFTAAMVLGRYVSLRRVDRDRAGRTVAWVYVDGSSLNQELLNRGLAWHFKKYSDDRSLSLSEDDARSRQAGLWSDPAPIPPWDYRDKQRKPLSTKDAFMAARAAELPRDEQGRLLIYSGAVPARGMFQPIQPNSRSLYGGGSYSSRSGSSYRDKPGHQGCCSNHGGVAGCEGGRVVCNDGSLSPSCGC